MAISFPTDLDTLTNPTATSKRNSPSHASQHADANDIIEAIEAKVGKDSSAVTTSHDYKLSGVTTTDKAVSLAGTETLTNKRLTSPKLNEDVAVTATATEVNLIDGCNASTAELNIVDGGETTEKVLNVQSKARAYPSTDQLNLANNTWTKVTLDTEGYDIGGDFASDKFTAPVTGYYLVIVQVTFSTTVDETEYACAIYLNGSRTQESRTTQSAGTSWVSPCFSTVTSLTATDYIELWAKQTSGGATTDVESDGGTGHVTWLEVHLLSV